MGLEVFNYECQDQISMFDLTMQQIKIDKPVRLIETFSGYGSQAMALNVMGADFEHYKISEWEVNANKSYKACHINDNTDYSEIYNKEKIINKLLVLGISNDGKKPMTEKEIRRKSEKWQRETYNEFMQCHNLGSIMNIHGNEFEIIDTDTYFYFFTYSYPCTSVSIAGKMEGMKEGSGTQSSLLWEIKRILKEIHGSKGELPQLLFMENVPQVLAKANIKDFQEWQDFLTLLGYTNHVQTLNAKDYGVAQNRERTFMFSFLGEYNYKFPNPIPLTKTMKDYLEEEVDEKYYINTEKADKLITQLIDNRDLHGCVGNVNPSGNGMNGNVYSGNLAPTLTTNKGEGQNIVEVNQVGNIAEENKFSNPQTGRVYATDGCAPTLNTCSGGGHEPKICVDLSINNPSENNITNCITARDRGISNHRQVGNGVIVAMCGRNTDNSSDRTPGNPTEQRLEPNSQGICNTITSMQKDNMVLETNILGGINYKVSEKYQHGLLEGMSRSIMTNNDGAACVEEIISIKQVTKDNCIESIYRIRKLTPRECGRLMYVSDSNITKILSVVSNSQAYKQFGNSIVVLVMVAMFSNLNIQGLPRWDAIKERYMR